MKRESLNDYSNREKEQFGKFLTSYVKDTKIEYPPKSRFNKLVGPIVDTTTNIWTQIPFYGSSLIHIHPCSQDALIKYFGWGTKADIENLVSLSKDTGRVQFIFDKDPKDYEPFDYLDPILELRPPLMQLVPKLVFDEKEYKIAENEYDTLCEYKFVSYLNSFYSQNDLGLSYPSFNEFSFKFRQDYATLKLSGYEEIAQKILDLLIDNPELALDYFFLFGTLITPSYHDSFYVSYNPVYSIDGSLLTTLIKKMSNLSQSNSSESNINIDVSKQAIPGEIGSALIKKLAFGAEGYHGCIFLMDKYKQEDLNKLLSSIQEGVNAKEIDQIRSNTIELSIVLDNLWKDANNIAKRSSYVSWAVPFTLGLVGPIASHEVGLVGGLLAAIGAKTLDKKIIPISEKLAKIRSPNHLVAIYDFMQKYNIKN